VWIYTAVCLTVGSAQIGAQSHLISSISTKHMRRNQTTLGYSILSWMATLRSPESPVALNTLLIIFHFRLKAINCLLSPALPSLSLSLLLKMPAAFNCSD